MECNVDDGKERFWALSDKAENHGQVAGEKLYGHGQQDDAEELAQHVDDIGTEPVGDFIEVAQHEEVNEDVQRQTDHDVDGGIFGVQRDEGGDGTRTGDEGKGDGHDAGARRGGLVLDDVASQYHLEGQYEKHHGARDGKRWHVDAEQFEQRVAQKIEANEENQRRQRSLEGLDLRTFVAHRYEDGDGASDVDDGKHDKESAEYFYYANHFINNLHYCRSQRNI